MAFSLLLSLLSAPARTRHNHAHGSVVPPGQLPPPPVWIPSILHPISGRPASPQSLPGLQLNANESKGADEKRGNQYGGKGDATHLGGFTDVDPDGLSPALWRYMMQNLTVKSVLDLGCGKGISTSWFAAHDADVLCVEGSSDAVQHSRVPGKVVEHDFSRGPWWPNKTYDAVWSVEFAEHVGRQLMHNYMPIIDSAALVFITHSMWGGWHHVEVHNAGWWRTRLTAQGLVYSDELTKAARKIALDGNKEVSAKGLKYNAQHLWTSLQIYINPAVMRLPEHAHLIGNAGCFAGQNHDIPDIGDDAPNVPCEGGDALPPEFQPPEAAFKSDAMVGWSPEDQI